MKYVVAAGLAIAITSLLELDVPGAIVVGLLVGGLVGTVWVVVARRVKGRG